MTVPSLTDYIWYEPGWVDSAFCDEVVARAEDTNYHSGTIMSGEVLKTVRDVNITAIRQWPDLDHKLFEIYGSAIREYCGKHTDLHIERDEGYSLLKYDCTQSYSQHVDHGTAIPRSVTAIIGLNEEYTGGEFFFWDGAWQQKIEKGALLMFPASFQYPHGIRQILSGTRYSVITWFL